MFIQKQDLRPDEGFLKILCGEYIKNNTIDPSVYNNFKIKKGLRNADGSGVVAGITHIGNVHGFIMNEGEKEPIQGRLTYRGIDINDLIEGFVNENRFGFEETIYLLLIGRLPTKDELCDLSSRVAEMRALPDNFIEDMIIKAPCSDIMNKLARATLALYTYDEGDPDDTSLENMIRQGLYLIARFPMIISAAYQVKRHYYDGRSLVLRYSDKNNSIAQDILHLSRFDGKFTEEEARLLDLCLVLHAEHGGGNNSTFACRVLSSSGTDTYSAVASAVGSLKGPRHGGANIKVVDMFEDIKQNVKNWADEGELADYLVKILNKQAGDKSGLIYGMGHAVYTLSDPRAVILKKYARSLAEKNGFIDEFNLIESVERLTPEVFKQEKGIDKAVCANVDMYSGMVYRMLKIPRELYTPLFAAARIVGWMAHRIEEVESRGKIMRPAYKSVSQPQKFVPLNERG